MEKQGKSPRKSRKRQNPVKVIDHNIPHEVMKGHDANGDKVKCSYCRKLSNSINEHKEHTCKKINDFLLKCLSCNKRYVDHRLDAEIVPSREDGRNDNSAVVSGEDPVVKSSYQCCVCRKSYSDLSYTVRHIKYHVHRKTAVAEPSLHCGHCNKAFVTKQQLNKHETVHTDARPFKCQECDKWFKTQDNVKRHMYVHNDATPFACSTCGKEFKAKHMLKKHEETHNDQRLFECPKCDKKYKAKNSLRDHLRVHSGQRPYKCQQCSQAFYRPSHLATHKLVHSKLKPFTCKDCEKSFGRREHLKVHERIHSGEKPFKCNLCERSFNQQAGLQAHLVSHSGDRPHTCLKCTKTFKYPSQVKHHSCKAEPRVRTFGDEGEAQRVHVNPSLPDTEPTTNDIDCGVDENEPNSNGVSNSAPCLNTPSTIILIQIHNAPGTTVLNANMSGTQQVIGCQSQNGASLEGSHDILQGNSAVLPPQQLTEATTPTISHNENQRMVIGIEDIIGEVLEKI